MPKPQKRDIAQVQPRHLAEEALRELEALAAEWIARQRQRVAAAAS